MGSEYFVIGYDFIQHMMCKAVSGFPYNPIDITNIFNPSDDTTITWTKFVDVSELIELKWDFKAPNGSNYRTYEGSAGPPSPAEIPAWYVISAGINIRGHDPEYMCGRWTVIVSEKDVYGNWDELYRDYFRIEESTPPFVSIDIIPQNPVETQIVSVNISATDNNHLRKVVLHWNDGIDHSLELNANIDASSFQDTVAIGSFQNSQAVSYWAEAWDESGNRIESVHENFVVQPEIVTTPSSPTGPVTLQAGEIGQYESGGATINLGGQAEYQFDWGNEPYSDWGDSIASNSWATEGLYNVRARARSQSNTEIISDWSTALEITVEPLQTANLLVDSTLLVYNVIQSGMSPHDRQININSDGTPLEFTVSNLSTWLTTDISTGSTNQGVTVMIDITGLAEGSYLDTIKIESPMALNSPLQIVCSLSVNLQQEIISRSVAGTHDVNNGVTITSSGFVLSKVVAILPVPKSNEYQNIEDLSITAGELLDIPETEDRYLRIIDNSNALPSPGYNITYSYDFTVTLYSVEIDLASVNAIYDYDTASERYHMYTGSSGVYVEPLHQQIVLLGNSLWSEATNLIDYARRCYEYVASEYDYLNPNTGIHPLDDILSDGGGDCGNLSSIYISLLRYMGIPSRHIVTVRLDGTYHVWADFYLENYGWVPVDVTSKLENPSGDYFGQYDGNGIVVSREVWLQLDRGDLLYHTPLLQTFEWWMWGTGSESDINAIHVLNADGTAIDDDDELQIPNNFSLSQNYPNPFNPSTVINFELPRASHVSINIYNIMGRKIRTLVDERLSAGKKVVTWNGKDEEGETVSSGIYFYRINTDNYSESKKMILLK